MKLQRRLAEVLKGWSSVIMWTLTIDPELFPDPKSAYAHCAKRRAVGELVKELDRRGVLLSRDYFCAVEYQQNGMPHFHLLLHAKHVPFDLVCDIWNRNRPASAGPVEGNRPGFGSVRFSKVKFAQPAEAAKYVTKYVIKPPENGWPEWVLNYRGVLPRYSVSKGFWGGSEQSAKLGYDVADQGGKLHPVVAAWFLDGREAINPYVLDAESDESALAMIRECDPEWWDARFEEIEVADLLQPPTASERELKSIRERIAKCRQGCCIIERRQWVDPRGEVQTQTLFQESLPLPYAEALEALGVESTAAVNHACRLRIGDLSKLRQAAANAVNREQALLNAAETALPESSCGRASNGSNTTGGSQRLGIYSGKKSSLGRTASSEKKESLKAVGVRSDGSVSGKVQTFLFDLERETP